MFEWRVPRVPLVPGRAVLLVVFLGLFLRGPGAIVVEQALCGARLLVALFRISAGRHIFRLADLSGPKAGHPYHGGPIVAVLRRSHPLLFAREKLPIGLNPTLQKPCSQHAVYNSRKAQGLPVRVQEEELPRGVVGKARSPPLRLQEFLAGAEEALHPRV